MIGNTLFHLRFWVLPTLVATFGCSPQLNVPVAHYPAGVLRVRFEPAVDHESCLIAAVAMAAEYTEGRPYRARDLRRDAEARGLDFTRPGDLAQWLRTRALDMVILKGELSPTPPLGLAYWVRQRGYPAICIINRKGEEPDYNHAVVVIGVAAQASDNHAQADTIKYLDPSSPKGLETTDVDTFRTWWTRGGNAMLIVVRPPQSGQALREPRKLSERKI